MPGFEWFGDPERAEVEEVLDTGVLFRYGFDEARKGHWKAREFEQAFAARLGVAHCHLVSSGTAALSTALAACGVGAGAEVIVPPFTFIATIEAVLQAGAVPVFADIDETLCLDPRAVDSAITPDTRAVIPVHMCGSMARIDRIAEICRDQNLVLIEDTAQAVGASFEGQALGTFGQMGCFSFDPVKTITCGEGGAVTTQDAELYRLAEHYSDHGHDHLGVDRGRDTHPILGTNHRISELHAAVGLAQLRRLDEIVATQRRHKLRLREAFAQSPEVGFRVLPDPDGDSATFLSLLLPDADRARELSTELTTAGIGPSFYWYDNNWHYLRRWDHLKALRFPAQTPIQLMDAVPDYSSVSLETSDRILARTLSLLIKLSWSEAELDTLGGKIRDVLGVS